MIRVLEKIKNSKRMPALFIGSGISRRYINNYPNWDELLIKIANKLGINETTLLAIKQKLSTDNSINNVLPQLATYLANDLLDKIISNPQIAENIFPTEYLNQIKTNSWDYFKSLIALEFQNIQLTTNKKYLSEIDHFKNAIDHISAILTTNYDHFLENIIFDNKVKVYDANSKYYFSNNFIYGELYKIHGNIDNPNTIVITHNDYKKFDEDSPIIVSKIYNILLESPIIFLGYSMNDENINKILSLFVNSFPSTLLKDIEENMIYVSWKKDCNELIEGRKSFNVNGKNFTMTLIETDNYSLIYDFINELEITAKASEIRKYKKMIAEIVHSNIKGKQNIIIQDSKDIESLNSENTIIAFTSQTPHYAYIGKSISDLMYSALYDEKIDGNIIITDWYKRSKVQKTAFCPVGYFLKNATIPFENSDQRFQENYQHILAQFDAKSTILLNTFKGLTLFENEHELIHYLKSESHAYKRNYTLLYNFYYNKITKERYVEMLKNFNSNIFDNIDTSLRKAITYIDLK